jgi:hypothetical protein
MPTGSASCSIVSSPIAATSKLAARLRYARLRRQATVEDVDYRAPRGLDRALFHKLANGDWIETHDNFASPSCSPNSRSPAATAAMPASCAASPACSF